MRAPIMIVAAAAGVLALAGCAGPAPDFTASPPPVVASTTWRLVVDGPQGAWTSCTTDPAVAKVDDETGASDPRLVIILATTAEQTDADRIRICLTTNLTAGTVDVTAPS